MIKFQLRHGNDLLAMDSIRECDVSFKTTSTLSSDYIDLLCYSTLLISLAICTRVELNFSNSYLGVARIVVVFNNLTVL